MAIAIAIPLALGATGTALAMTSGSIGPKPIKQLLPPQPSPSADTQLPKPLQKVLSSADQPGDTSGSGTTDTSSAGSDSSASVDSNAPSLQSGLGWAWNIPYGGWRRFFQAGEPYGSSQVTYTQTVPAPGAASAGTATLAQVASSVPQTPAYLWVLLPLGLLLLWAASLAVFEPLGDRGRLVLMIGSVRRTARELPAGMTRSGARTAVRVFRRFGPWARR
jgi:hypothetical protein